MIQDMADPISRLAPVEPKEPKMKMMQRMRNNFKRWWRSVGAQFRAIRRAGYLLCLFSPVAATYPIAMASKGTFPDVEQAWWDAVLWSIQQASPTIIKFTQWASSRRDLFDDEFCDRFQAVQADGTHHSMKVTEQILAEAYGPDWRERIELEDEVVGAGCMAQVYGGFLKNGQGRGQHVAVKIMHPNMQESVSADLAIMGYMLSYFKNTKMHKHLNLDQVFADFKHVMLAQVDMRNEAENLQKLRENFKDEDAIIFPEPMMKHTTAEVLVEEFIDAAPVLQFISESVDSKIREHLAETGLQALLKMVMFHNFVHADLHPGNIMVSQNENDSSKPNLVFLDAGIVTEYGKETHQHIKDIFLTMLTHHGEQCAKFLVDNSEKNSDMETLEESHFVEEIKFLVEDRSEGEVTGRVAELLNGLFKACCDHHVMLDASFMTVAMAVEVMEGIAKSLDPKIDVVEKARAVVMIDEMKERMKGFFGDGDKEE